MKKQMTVRKTVLAALFLAIGLILPFITMQIPAVGRCFAPCTFRYYCVDIFSEDRMADRWIYYTIT